MKLHTSLNAREILAALRCAQYRGLIAPDVHTTILTPGPSRTHPYRYEIQLGSHDKHSLPAGYRDRHGTALRVRRHRNSPRGGAEWAATWHEWGWFIAEVFTADPESRWGANPARSRRPWGYFSPDDFHAKTGGQFRPAPEETASSMEPPVTDAEASAALSYISQSQHRPAPEEAPVPTRVTPPLTLDDATRWLLRRGEFVTLEGANSFLRYIRLTGHGDRETFSVDYTLPGCRYTFMADKPDPAPRRQPVTEALAAQGTLAPGAPGWREVPGAQVGDIRPGDLIMTMPDSGTWAEYAILGVSETPPWGTQRRLVTCDGEALHLGLRCPVTVLRRAMRSAG